MQSGTCSLQSMPLTRLAHNQHASERRTERVECDKPIQASCGHHACRRSVDLGTPHNADAVRHLTEGLDLRSADWSVERRRERHLPREPDADRTENISPGTMFAELAVGFPAQFLDMESGLVRVNDEGGADDIIEIFGEHDEGCLAEHVIVKLDRPGWPKSGDNRGEMLALPWSERFETACGWHA